MKLPTYRPVMDILLSLVPLVASMTTDGRPGNGLIGYGISMFDPPCAYACKQSITNPLDCKDDHYVIHMNEASPSPQCYVENIPFLQTLAYCIHTRCVGELNSTLEKWWETNVAGRALNQPKPEESNQLTLEHMTEPPDFTVDKNEFLHSAILISNRTYLTHYTTITVFEKMEATHEKYGLVLLITGTVIPIGASLLRLIPFPTLWRARLNAYCIYPPFIGRRHQVPYFKTFLMPTRGQGLFIGWLILINVGLCAVGISSTQPNSWYKSKENELLTYIANRAGVLSFANLPLLVLYSGRNNILLWLTNWSHSTFLMLHRWVALLCTLEACVHTAIHIWLFAVKNEYMEESKLPYWNCGFIAIAAFVILIPTSLFPIRRKIYEIFAVWHVLLAMIALIGCYLHIYYRFTHQWGYELWIYIAASIWSIERLLRILRIARHGVKRAYISIVDDDYIRIEIPSITAHGHVYLYFPTLTWRIWENHPFSTATNLVCDRKSLEALESGSISSSSSCYSRSSGFSHRSLEARIASTTPYPLFDSHRKEDRCHRRNNLVFFVKVKSGLTKRLRNRGILPVLVELSYSPTSLTKSTVTDHPNIIAIAGGAGITAIAPLLRNHRGWHKLFWAVRSSKLVHSVDDMMGETDF